MDEDLSMGEADFERITAALAAKKVRVTIDVLPEAVASKDWAANEELAADRLARHELGIRGVWVHDIKDMNSTHSLEHRGADPDQQKRLIASGAVWVGPRHLAPT
jgi:hypothetical protein